MRPSRTGGGGGNPAGNASASPVVLTYSPSTGWSWTYHGTEPAQWFFSTNRTPVTDCLPNLVETFPAGTRNVPFNHFDTGSLLCVAGCDLAQTELQTYPSALVSGDY